MEMVSWCMGSDLRDRAVAAVEENGEVEEMEMERVVMEMEESLWRLKMAPVSVSFLCKNFQFLICCNRYFGKSSIPIL